MSGWALIIILMSADGTPEAKKFGDMESQEYCIIAGVGTVAVIEAANPGTSFEWHCVKAGDPA